MNDQKKKEIKEQGKEGERLFRDWLKECDAPFLYVDNGYESYTTLFKNKIKRPDFLLLVSGMGLLAVDVKHLSKTKNNGFTLTIENELKYAIEFEHAFKLYLWYAVKVKGEESDNWYFISAYDAIKHGEQKQNYSTKEWYVEISIKHFTIMTDAKRIDKLLKHSKGITGLFTDMVEGYFRSTRKL